MLSSIPSTPFQAIGPFRMYGLMIALGVLAAVWLAQRRYVAAGGDRDVIGNLAFVAVPAGLVADQGQLSGERVRRECNLRAMPCRSGVRAAENIDGTDGHASGGLRVTE